MDSAAVEGLRELRAALLEARTRADQIMDQVLARARALDPADRDAATELLSITQLVGRGEQAEYGRLILLLAQADRIKAARGGVKAWAVSHLDLGENKARGIAQAARRIGAIPQLTEPLASGQVGADTVAALSRAAKAVAHTSRDTATTLTTTLATAQTDGVIAARRQVRELEHTLDPDNSKQILARQRAQSFLRVIELENGLCRIEALLDPVRATVLRTALDAQTADWIRRAQYDHAQPLPEDVRSTEQINAHALVRLAEVFLTTPAHLRKAHFTMPMLFSAPRTASATDPLARSVYGDMVPRENLPECGDAGTHLIELDPNGQPVALDGADIDITPIARLANHTQRTALEFRDRHCTYPGCNRPPTFSLHAHHHIPFRDGGPTSIRNLTLLCSEHHVLTHQE
jgi:hypothetical protein